MGGNKFNIAAPRVPLFLRHGHGIEGLDAKTERRTPRARLLKKKSAFYPMFGWFVASVLIQRNDLLVCK